MISRDISALRGYYYNQEPGKDGQDWILTVLHERGRIWSWIRDSLPTWEYSPVTRFNIHTRNRGYCGEMLLWRLPENKNKTEKFLYKRWGWNSRISMADMKGGVQRFKEVDILHILCAAGKHTRWSLPLLIWYCISKSLPYPRLFNFSHVLFLKELYSSTFYI